MKSKIHSLHVLVAADSCVVQSFWSSNITVRDRQGLNVWNSRSWRARSFLQKQRSSFTQPPENTPQTARSLMHEGKEKQCSGCKAEPTNTSSERAVQHVCLCAQSCSWFFSRVSLMLLWFISYPVLGHSLILNLVHGQRFYPHPSCGCSSRSE